MYLVSLYLLEEKDLIIVLDHTKYQSRIEEEVFAWGRGTVLMYMA
jgi:hypothetical protein